MNRSTQKGFALLEALVAAAILLIVIWGSMSYTTMALRARQQAHAAAAITPYSSHIVSAIYEGVEKYFFAMASGGQSVTCSCGATTGCLVPGPAATSTFTAGSTRESELADCASVLDVSGIRIAMIVQSQAGSPPPGAGITEPLGPIFSRCISDTTIKSAAPVSYLANTNFYWCALVTVSPGSTLTPERSNLLAMQPVLVELSYYSFLFAPILPAQPVTKILSLADLGTLLPQIPPNPMPTNPALPVVNYLYYTFHYMDQKENGGMQVVKHFTGVVKRGAND